MDRRELILQRLFVIASSLDIANKFRNVAPLAEDQRDGITLLDGDERVRGTQAGERRGASAGYIVDMFPEIYIALKNRTHRDEINVGTRLNSYRAQLIPAITDDGLLQNLVGPQGAIVYTSVQTDLARGRELNGEMGLAFTLTYILRPNKLT